MADAPSVRILYMEDDSDLAFLLQRRLNKENYTVDIIDNGAEGIVLLENNRYDVLLVDYDMPVYGGLDVIRTLAARDALPPTVMVTGHGNEKVAVEAMKLGAEDYIVKGSVTVYLELLPIVIDHVLQKERLARERTRLFEVLKESEEHYRQLVELSPDGIAMHVGEEVTFVNPTGVKLLGAANVSELIGRSIYDFAPPDEHLSIAKRLQNVRLGQQIPWLEHSLRRVDGSEIQVEIAGTSFIHKGKPAMQVIFRDITEKVRMQKALLESEERFRTIADFTYDWEYWYSPQGEYIYISPSCERITGYTPDDFYQNANLLKEIIHPDDLERFLAYNCHKQEDVHIGPIDIRIITRSGDTRWIGHICQPVYTANGDYLGRRASNRDITRRKQTEDFLRESETYYRTIVQTSPDAIFHLDLESNILLCNQQAANLFGAETASELIGQNSLNFIVPEDRELIGRSVGLVIKHGSVRNIKYHRFRKDGKTIPVEASASLVTDTNGDPQSIIAIVRRLNASSAKS